MVVIRRYRFNEGGLLWAKTSPTSLDGISPDGEPGYSYRVQADEDGKWQCLRTGGTYFAGDTEQALEAAVKTGDDDFKRYRDAVSEIVSELEAEIDTYLDSALDSSVFRSE